MPVAAPLQPPDSPWGPNSAGAASAFSSPAGGLLPSLGLTSQAEAAAPADRGDGTPPNPGRDGARVPLKPRQGGGPSGACGVWTSRPRSRENVGGAALAATSRGRAVVAPPQEEPLGAVRGTARELSWLQARSRPGGQVLTWARGERAQAPGWREGGTLPPLRAGRGHRRPWAWSCSPQGVPTPCCPGCLLRCPRAHTCRPPPRPGPSRGASGGDTGDCGVRGEPGRAKPGVSRVWPVGRRAQSDRPEPRKA